MVKEQFNLKLVGTLCEGGLVNTIIPAVSKTAAFHNIFSYTVQLYSPLLEHKRIQILYEAVAQKYL